MPSKISFFRSIQWKLSLYFMGIMLFAVVIMMFLFGPPPERERLPELMMRHDTRTGMIAKQIGAQFSRGDSPAAIQENLANIAFLTGSHLKLLDSDGKIVMSTDFNLSVFDIGKINLSPEELKELDEGRWVSGQKLLPQRGLTLAVYYSAYPVYSKLKREGILFSLIPLGPPARSKGIIGATLLQGVLCALAISSGAAFLLSWNFLRPILKMRKASEKLSRGDFSARIEMKGGDEIGELAGAFDSMSSKLKENIEGRMRLMGDISHEINSPLTAIRVNTEAMLDGIIDVQNEAEREKVLSSMLHQTRRISALVDDLLELAKFEAGAIKMNMEPFTAAEPVNSVIESVRLAASGKKMTVECDIQDESLKARGDKGRITQVLQNLVNNSIQHNSEGIHIKVSLRREDGRVRYSIEDDGVGIPAQELENVFKRFHRIDRGTEADRSGSGLGLAIVKEIIEAHGGRISVSSPGKGTQFFFSLPAV